ncbi:MAG: indole-3-glycerol phosphate synthase TrpC [Bacillota bacterium]
MPMILDEIVKDTRQRVEALYDQDTLENWKSRASECHRPQFLFYETIRKHPFSIIAEVKKASPSKGVISEPFNYLDIAQDYKDAHADCISVLTEPYHFLGKNKHLKDIKNQTSMPVLRKDFIIDEIQIYESIVLGADCILLICSILSEEQLSKFITIAHSFGLSVLVEAHDLSEVKKALASGSEMIGVNNRDLKTFTVDVNHSLRLRKHVHDGILFVSESGIASPEDIKQVKAHNIHAVLIGEALMRSPNKKALIKEYKDA